VSKHRDSQRTLRRRGRVAALALALGVTILVGGTAAGVLPSITGSAEAGPATGSAPTFAALGTAALTDPAPAQAAEQPATDAVDVTAPVDPAVPADSGTGRRVVFDEGDQRVWLVNDDDSVERTYPVSGSRFDNLDPGSYEVLSTTRHATAFDGSGTMEYFVHFTTGFSEPIGFHSVPRDNDGKLEQTKQQLGTPLSAGCVRQWEPDAVALWDFAPIGTPVVVTA